MIHIKSKHNAKKSPCGGKQEKTTINSPFDCGGDDYFISEDEDESIENENSKYSYRKETNNKNPCRYLCPISSCTFFLLEKSKISELTHIKRIHPHVDNQMSFIVLEYEKE